MRWCVPMRTRVGACLVLTACVLARGVAKADCADTRSVVVTGSPADKSQPIGAALAAEARRARSWRFTWTGINGGLTVLALAAIPILPRSERPQLILSASVSALSTSFTWFWPLDVEADSEAAARLGDLPPPECEAKLRQLFENSAHDESSRRAWPWHVGNFVTAIIPASIIWFGFHAKTDGAIALASGFALGEVELLTQPTGLVDLHAPRGVPTTTLGTPLIIGYRSTW